MQRKIQKTPPMISYMSTILQAADTCSPGFGWRKYDEQFRLKLASSPNMAWDVIDNHLWLMCIINQQPEITEVKETKVEKPRRPFPNSRGGYSRPRGRVRGSDAMASNFGGHQAPSTPFAREIPNTCDYFNRSGCTKRDFRHSHTCSNCGGSHPQFKCNKK
jgi:hypothetical protein